MKSSRVSVTITDRMVEDSKRIFGDQPQLLTILPMLFYRNVDIPWKAVYPPILRRQKNICTKELVVGKFYQCEVLLKNEMKRRNYVFYTQTLLVYDENGDECFQCVSELVTTSLLLRKK